MDNQAILSLKGADEQQSLQKMFRCAIIYLQSRFNT